MDAVRSFERWKKKYTRRTKRLRLQRKERKRPEWQVERENIGRLVQRYPEINASEIQRFSDFPLSKKTLKGLQEAQYRVVTEIQRQTIGLALQGKDVLGAAKTGSGKTLAFIIPALELLFRQQWTSADGLGVLIISPTRELAYQTFKVLRKVGKNHEFSAGLIIGGKDLKEESERIHHINMLICTPGRLLQHMDETSYFYASDLQMLILDEADRILDMGFADTMNAIIENLPKKRQTLLFSATQTKSVKDLARLSLKDPEYVWVHEKAKFSTPATLDQNYVVCELQQKVNMLYSFLRTHLKKKSIVFFASCKEVQYLFRVFCKLQPGLPVLALHGKQQQMKRMEVYTCFVRKKAAVLFATDIAARGLDFPAVNWVIQFDCPEDANTYIHRVGRTARYKEGGEALLVLLPSEEKGMVEQLAQRKVPISEIKINPEKLTDIQKRMQAFLAQDQELKDKAQRCFVSYLRSVYLMKNKEVFDVFKLPLAEYALSLGLAMAPRVRFLQRVRKQLCAKEAANGTDHSEETEENENVPSSMNKGEEKCGTNFSGKGSGNKTKENERRKETEECSASSEGAEESSESEDELKELSEEEEDEKEVPVPSRVPNSDSVQFFEDDDDDDDDTKDLDLLTVKQRDVFGVESKDSPAPTASKSKMKKKITKTQEAKKILKKKFKVNTKVVFTEDGELVQQWPPVQKSSLAKADEDDDATGINLDKAKEILREEDKFDKEEYRKKVKEKHREKRLKEKAARREARNKTAQAFGNELIPATMPLKKATVFLNPAACKGKARSLFEKNAAPILHLSGLDVTVVKTDYEGQAKKLLELMENTDLIIIAGGDGTVQEVITGLLRRADEAAFSKIPIGFIPLGKTCTLSHTLYPESTNQVQHITNATLAILKGETVPLDVLQIKGEKEQPVFAVSSLRWGSYRDAGVKVSKYWYLGPLKTKAAHFFSTIKEWPQKHQAALMYVGPTERPPEEPEEKPSRPPLYVRLYRRLRLYWSSPKEIPREVTPEDWEELKLSTIELSIATRNRQLDLTDKGWGIVCTYCSIMGVAFPDVNCSISESFFAQRTEDFMDICIEADAVSKGEFVHRGSQKMRDPHMCPEGSQCIQASRCILQLPEGTEGSFGIDNEEYEAMPVEVKLLPRKLRFFCDPRIREQMLHAAVQ